MFDVAVPAPAFDELYPEQGEIGHDEWLDRLGVAITGRISRYLRSRPKRIHSIASRVNLVAEEYVGFSPEGLRVAARELRCELKRHGLRDDLVVRAFALVRESAERTLGMRHFDEQMIGGWILLNGMIAEMHTGEGKTLMATLPACTAGLAGIPVHVITVNDYLVQRDCELMRPIYETLGLTVAAVTEGMDHQSRQRAYGADVVYCSNKTVVFDYLRDRILLGASSSSLHLKLERIYGPEARIRRLLLRGLNFAIVDEADSVLVDEARTPLIISSEVPSGDEALVARQAVDLARQLAVGDDFIILLAERRLALTEAGHRRVIELCKVFGGVWSGALRREELVVQALTALHLFHRDEHYLLRDGKIQVIDEFTGRVMADRSWGQGLHQLIETKEGCEITARKETLARISYQRFFRRYRHLSGMSGTAAEVAGELGDVYGLAVVPVPTHLPSKRIHLPDIIVPTEEEKWRQVADRVATLHARGVPVLLGTRSVVASEVTSRILSERGLAHRVLSAKQDKEEAEIIAEAGEMGRITIATNMAGRGTDISLGPGVADAGGLHVILTERHEAGRIDRQLGGRCARQGDPGCFEAILSLEDPLLLPFKDRWLDRVLRRFTRPGGPYVDKIRRLLIRYAQRRTERAQSKIRRKLLKADREQVDILSFSGRPE
ncbi:MAG: prepilin peptidase [Rhodocyclaceae bacterium]|nr:prepilin peptidase [Rhodocyclaceae bacterium]